MSAARLPSVRRSTRTTLTVAVTVLSTCGILSACSAAPSLPDSIGNVPDLSTLGHPTIAVTGWHGKALDPQATGIMPGAPITVTAREGSLSSVKVTGPDGDVKGAVAADGATWTSTGTLDYGSDYQINATARGIEGEGATKVAFTTATADSLASVSSVVDDHETVGIGQPVAINFDAPVSDKRTAQDAITITTDPPVEGAFYWVNDSMLRWRPEHFWAPGTKVHVAAKTAGINLVDGVYGDNDLTTDFTVGRKMVSVADDKTHQITVSVNDKVVRTMPTSMGKDSTPTNNGIYVVAERAPSVIMDSSTYGVPVNSPGGYKEVVYDATRISFSGIYVHSAPWSLGDQGYDDVSNGCLNVSPENAEWFLTNSLRGDVVIAKNTVGPILPGDDGLGDWNVPWAVWKKGNA